MDFFSLFRFIYLFIYIVHTRTTYNNVYLVHNKACVELAHNIYAHACIHYSIRIVHTYFIRLCFYTRFDNNNTNINLCALYGISIHCNMYVMCELVLFLCYFTLVIVCTMVLWRVKLCECLCVLVEKLFLAKRRFNWSAWMRKWNETMSALCIPYVIFRIHIIISFKRFPCKPLRKDMVMPMAVKNIP